MPSGDSVVVMLTDVLFKYHCGKNNNITYYFIHILTYQDTTATSCRLPRKHVLSVVCAFAGVIFKVIFQNVQEKA